MINCCFNTDIGAQIKLEELKQLNPKESYKILHWKKGMVMPSLLYQGIYRRNNGPARI